VRRLRTEFPHPFDAVYCDYIRFPGSAYMCKAYALVIDKMIDKMVSTGVARRFVFPNHPGLAASLLAKRTAFTQTRLTAQQYPLYVVVEAGKNVDLHMGAIDNAVEIHELNQAHPFVQLDAK
jgi:hypothetical protein